MRPSRRNSLPGRAAADPAHMVPMPILDTDFIFRRPVKHRVTILEDENDVHNFSRATDCYPASDGTFRRERKDFSRDDIPLLGSYFVEELDEDGDPTGRFEVFTGDEFRDKLTEHCLPRRQYGIQWLVRPEQVAPHLSVEHCREAMDAMPVLKSSGEYRIVTRQGPSEPGPWEPVEDDE